MNLYNESMEIQDKAFHIVCEMKEALEKIGVGNLQIKWNSWRPLEDSLEYAYSFKIDEFLKESKTDCANLVEEALRNFEMRMWESEHLLGNRVRWRQMLFDYEKKEIQLIQSAYNDVNRIENEMEFLKEARQMGYKKEVEEINLKSLFSKKEMQSAIKKLKESFFLKALEKEQELQRIIAEEMMRIISETYAELDKIKKESEL